MDVELAPCPFCKGPAMLVERGTYGVRCKKSDNHMLWAYGRTREAAIANWNTLQAPCPGKAGELREPDEITEGAIRSRAKALILKNGWKPGDRPGLHSVVELMTAIGMHVAQQPPKDRCAYPECGCDFDATCANAPGKPQDGGNQGSVAGEADKGSATPSGVWVVMGSTGEYSDRGEWSVFAFAREQAAKDYVGLLTHTYRAAGGDAGEYGKVPGLSEIMRPLDPQFSRDYTGTRWWVSGVDWGPCEGVATNPATDGEVRDGEAAERPSPDLLADSQTSGGVDGAHI